MPSKRFGVTNSNLTPLGGEAAAERASSRPAPPKGLHPSETRKQLEARSAAIKSRLMPKPNESAASASAEFGSNEWRRTSYEEADDQNWGTWEGREHDGGKPNSDSDVEMIGDNGMPLHRKPEHGDPSPSPGNNRSRRPRQQGEKRRGAQRDRPYPQQRRLEAAAKGAAKGAAVLEIAKGAAKGANALSTDAIATPIPADVSAFVVFFAVIGILCALAAVAYLCYRAWRRRQDCMSVTPIDRPTSVAARIRTRHDPTGSAQLEQLDQLAGVLDPWDYWSMDPIRARVFGKKVIYIAKQAIACMTPDIRAEFWQQIQERHMPDLMPGVERARVANLAWHPTELEVLESMLAIPHKDLPMQAQTLLLANAQKLWRKVGDRAVMPERVFCVKTPSNAHKFHIDSDCTHMTQNNPPTMITMNRCEVCLKRERKRSDETKAE